MVLLSQHNTIQIFFHTSIQVPKNIGTYFWLNFTDETQVALAFFRLVYIQCLVKLCQPGTQVIVLVICLFIYKKLTRLYSVPSKTPKKTKLVLKKLPTKT